MARQEVAFSEECRKIKDFGSLREDFYTKFKPKNKGFGAVTWLENFDKMVVHLYQGRTYEKNIYKSKNCNEEFI